jgi:hypothetical protein
MSATAAKSTRPRSIAPAPEDDDMPVPREAEEVQAPQTQDRPAEAEIAIVAYQIFEERGCEHGHDLEHWLAAEERIRAARNNP